MYAASVALAAAAAGGLNVPEAVGEEAALPPSPDLQPAGASSDVDAEQAAADATAAQEQAARRAASRAAAAEEARKQAEVRAERRRQAVRAARKARAERAARAAERERLEEERERDAKRWVIPTSDYRLTAGFGDSGSRWSSNHTGQDFAAPIGTKVYAAAAGEIVSAGYEGAYGNKIVIRHADGTETWYAHLSAFEQTGGTVAAGELIGRVGSTGNSTGPHLHFEVRPGGGGPVAPLGWLEEHGAH
jgi:murein DD-endopeptidase MepM/ murein hydrolase activator NlpD